MVWYQLYFLGKTGDIRNADEFEAQTDGDATLIADHIHEAVCDLYAGYELWQETRRVIRLVDGGGDARPYLDYERINARMQASIIRREEIMQASETAFARSRRLLERLSTLQEVHAQSLALARQKSR